MATYPLAVTFPLPESGSAGTTADGTDLANGHKVFHYYPGLTGRFRIAVVGGVPPYVFSGSNLPAGMTVDDDTGAVVWTNPQTGTYSDVVFGVEDTEASTDSVTIELTVTTTGFRFADIMNGDNSWDGTSPTFVSGTTGPWRDLVALHAGGDSYVYLLNGTYSPQTDSGGVPITAAATGVPPASGGNNIFDDRYQWRQSSSRPTCLMAYPGHTPIIDMGSDHTDVTVDGNPIDPDSYYTPDGGYAPYLHLEGQRIFLQGVTFRNSHIKCLSLVRINQRGVYVDGCTFTSHGFTQAIDSSNPGCIFAGTLSPLFSFSDVLVGNYWSDMLKGPGILYSMEKPYIAFNRVDQEEGAVTEGLAYKGGPSQWNDYRNYWEAVTQAIGGDMALGYGEFWYSHMKQTGAGASDVAVELGRFSSVGAVTLTRCTVEGYPLFTNISSDDGPFVLTDCVVVNANARDSGTLPYADLDVVSDLTRITFVTSATPTAGQNLAGTSGDGILDADGLLQGSYRTTYLGSKGHEIVAGEGEPELAATGGPAFAYGGLF